ncbi:MAG: hypothetical protein ACKPJJ_09070, partial [Planctomycetaceae bacterium]
MITRLLTACAIFIFCQQCHISAEGRVYRERVEPHWNARGTSFWYRNNLPGDGRQFILVDAVNGHRTAAFDHAKLALKLAETLHRPIQADQLPVDS